MSQSAFRTSLQHLINSESMENGSNTPDYILAKYLARCLESFDLAVAERDQWYNVKLVPGACEFPQPGPVVPAVSPEEKPLDWEAARKYFDEVRSEYQRLAGTPGVNTELALSLTFRPLAQRFESGERTRELYDEMMGVQ